MRIRAAVLTVLVGAALAVPAAPAAAAACTSRGGVTVVVEFGSLGGGTQTRCASGNPSSGVAALRGAGFTPTRAAQEPGYFVCRIDGKPANDPCQRTSPPDAYWSYWHAKPGGSWTYSTVGPADYDPAPDTVEGWAFGAGKPPSSPPPRPTQPSPSAAPAPPPPPPASAAPSSPVPGQRPPASRAADPARTPATATTTTTVATASAPSASPTPELPPSPEPSTTGDSDVTSQVGIGLNVDDGPGLGVIAALLLLIVLLVAGAFQVRARRRQDRF